MRGAILNILLLSSYSIHIISSTFFLPCETMKISSWTNGTSLYPRVRESLAERIFRGNSQP